MTQPEPYKEQTSTPLIGHKRCLTSAGFGDQKTLSSRKRLRRTSRTRSISKPNNKTKNIKSIPSSRSPSPSPPPSPSTAISTSKQPITKATTITHFNHEPTNKKYFKGKPEIELKSEIEINTETEAKNTQQPSGLSFREAAVEILKDLDRPLPAKELITRILEAGLVSTTGKTPDRTLASLIYSDIRTNGSKSRFRKVAKGLFGLRMLYYPAHDKSPPSSTSWNDIDNTNSSTDTTPTPLIVPNSPPNNISTNTNSSTIKNTHIKRHRNSPTARKQNTFPTNHIEKTSTKSIKPNIKKEPNTSITLTSSSSSYSNNKTVECLLCSKVSTQEEMSGHPIVPNSFLCSSCRLQGKWLNQIEQFKYCGICGMKQENACRQCSIPCCSTCLNRLQKHNILSKMSYQLCINCNPEHNNIDITQYNIHVSSSDTSSICSQSSKDDNDGFSTFERPRSNTMWHRYSFGYGDDSKMPFKRTRNDEDENGFLFLQYFLYINRRKAYQTTSNGAQVYPPEDDCFACKNGGDLLVCDFPNCSKVYHKDCVQMDNIPDGKWFCPRHYCNTCHPKPTKTQISSLSSAPIIDVDNHCITCPTSYCNKHLPSNVTRYGSGIICERCHHYLENELSKI